MAELSPRARIWTWAALAAASLVVLGSSPAQYLGRQNDDILFIIAAQALSYGRYVLTTTPGSPPLVDVSPGFPFLLMPVVWLAGDWMPAYQIFCALILAACPWLIWLWSRSSLGSWAALLCGLIFACSPPVLGQAGCVMPEGAYTLICLGLLILLEKRRREPKAAGWLLLSLTQARPAGLSLLPGVLARPLGERRWRDAALMAGPALAGLLAWWLWCRAQAGSTQELSELSFAYAGQGRGRLLEVAWDNLLFYSGLLGSGFLPAAWAEAPTALGLGAALWLLAALGLGRGLARDPWDSPAWMLGCAGLMHAFWPWRYERYLIPLLPLLLRGLAQGLGRRAIPALALLLACQAGFHGRLWFRESSWSKPELARTYQWIRSNTGGTDIIASSLFARDGFYSARPSLPLPDRAAAADFAAVLKKQRVRFVLWQEGLDLGLSRDPTSPLRLALGAASRHLEDSRLFLPVYRNPAEGARVYALK